MRNETRIIYLFKFHPFQPQHYQSSSSLKIQPDEINDDDKSKDLELALDESFKSILGGGGGEREKEAANSESRVFKDQDFVSPSTPPNEKPPPPPPAGGGGDPRSMVDDAEVDKQEREIIASLEMEEREHKKYTMRKSSAVSAAAQGNY